MSTNDFRANLGIIALVVHGLATLVVILLFLKTGGMTVFCIVP